MSPRITPAQLKAGLAIVHGVRAIAKKRDEALRVRIDACKARMQAKSQVCQRLSAPGAVPMAIMLLMAALQARGHGVMLMVSPTL